MSTARQTNIELCRIVAMLLVVLVHSGIVAFGDIKQYDLSYWGILTMQGFAIVGVNVFVLISGYFSVSLRLKSIAKLVWICLFYALVACGIAGLLNHPIKPTSIFWVSNSIWYIATYIGLLCISPLLNTYVSRADRSALKALIIILIILQTWYEFVPRLINDFHNGYSILSFMILYLIARYVRLYGLPRVFRRYHIWIYISCSLLIAIGLICAVAFHFHPRGVAHWLLKYDNPLVIISSLGLFAFFEQIQMQNSKTINYIASSCIAVLLLHTSPAFSHYIVSLFHGIFSQYSGLLLVLAWGGIIVSEYVAAIAVDQIRLFVERKWVNIMLARIRYEIK